VTGPTTDKSPNIPADPVNGNADAPPPTKDNATDAVVANDAVVAYDADAIVPIRKDAVNAYDAEAIEPVIPPVTVRDPDIVELFCAIRPFLVTNSFGIFFTLDHCP
jgi:hypothetical protein